jgi:hypothetical protein
MPVACRLLPGVVMDEATLLDQNARLTPRLRLVSAAVVAARIVAGRYPTDPHAGICVPA